MREDLKVWLSFLSDYNGSTVMLDNVWTSNETICLFTDSAGGRDKGFGNNLTESQILNLFSIRKQCLYMDNFSAIFSPQGSLTQMGK
jgi:hypothetical protein